MSMSMIASASLPLPLPLPPVAARGPSSTALAPKLTIVREMLASLDTLSAAGQRYIMSKVVAFGETEAGRLREHIGTGNHRVLMGVLLELSGQSDRLWPDVLTFTDRADSLLTLLEMSAPPGGRRATLTATASD